MCRRSVLLLRVALVFLVGCGAPGERPLRVVLVTLDTLRHDAFAGSPEAAGAMPRLLARAAEGTRFTRSYAASSTTQPTHASLFTGLHPWQHGVTRNGESLDEGFVTLAESLADAGFETRAVVASYPLAAGFGFAQGFQVYQEEFTTGMGGARAWEGHRLPSERFFSDAATVTDRALASLDAARRPRQFFWFHYFDPHSPYGSTRGGDLMERDVARRIREGEPQARVIREVRELYRGDVAHLDRELERLLARLAQDARAIDTHVVVTADHGESLGEDGVLGHGYGLADVEIRVPTLVFSPALPIGLRAEPVGSVDLTATLLAMAGVAGAAGEGRDLAAAPRDRAPVVGMRRTFRTIGAGERLLDGSVRPIPDLLFYSVEAEGGLRLGNGRRLFGARRDHGARLRERFRGFERDLARHTGTGALDPAVEERLRALGYAP